MSDEIKLKPCPFCGGETVSVDTGEICCPVEYEAQARCSDCDAQGPGAYRLDTVEEAASEAKDLWNTRTDTLPTWQPIETAPRDGREIMTYPHYRVTFWSNECLTMSGEGWAGSWDEYTESFSSITPTHWMPLPTHPKGDTHD